MTQYYSLNVKPSNSQLNKLKSAIKNETDVVLGLSSNMIGNSEDETNFPHKPLLTNRQVANLRKAFTNYLSIDIKLSKTQLSKMIQSGEFLGRLLGLLPRTGLSVCFYHVTYAFQSESTLYSCLNVKELLARSRREI